MGGNWRKDRPMINVGLIDLLILVILVVSLVYAVRGRHMLPFAILVVIVLFIELERLAPGTMTAIGSMIHAIDAVNAQLPHVQIQPIISVQP
jgi:hypothetical protein